MEVINELKTRIIQLPIHSAVDLKVGSMLMPGITAETDLGTLIVNTAASNDNAIGVLAEPFSYASSGSALVDGTVDWFASAGGSDIVYPSRQVNLFDTLTMVKVDYDLTSYASVVSDVAGTITITNLEDNIDTSFLYCAAGTGIGQIGFIKTSAAGSCALTSDLTTPLDNTSKVVKILRLFHTLAVWTVPSATSATKLGTTAAAGTGRIINLQNYISQNGASVRLNPKSHHNIQGLNALTQFSLFSNVAIVNAGVHPIA